MPGSGGMLVVDTEMKANPYPVYARMRRETPVCKVLYGSGRSPVWMVTRYDDVVTVLKDARFTNDRRKVRKHTPVQMRVLHKLFAPLVNNMLNRDQPDHTRLRGLVHQAFTPKRVEDLRQRIESLTEELADRARRQWPWDVVADYAVPIPTTIIAEMLGVPVQDRERFKNWSNALLLSSATTWRGMAANVPRLRAFLRYIRGLVQERRLEPKDDLISALVVAEEAGQKLNEDELVSMVLLLLVAGYETTMNLIGNGTLALLENPEEMERLRAHPELLGAAVEEFARYYSPLDYATVRFTREGVTLSGVTIPAAETVVAAVGAANRDERQFTQPETLDVGRDPNRHLGFGMGMHYCLGAPLARLEAQAAFRTLLDRCCSLELAVHPQRLRWRKSTLLRGLESLPVRARAERALRTSA